MGAGAVAAAGAVELVDVGDIALRVAGHGFDRDFADFVARCAARLGLVGWIRIGSGEAMIRAVGSEDNLAALIRELRDHAPVDASVRGFELERVDALPAPPGEGFIALLETTVPAADPAIAGEPCAAADQAVLV
jgi:acylphosphatase